MKKVLCADRSESFKGLSERIIEIISKDKGIETSVDFVSSGNELAEMGSKNNYDLILTAEILYHSSGTEAIKKLRELDVKTPIIMISGDFEACKNSINIGSTDYVLKDPGKNLVKSIKEMIIKYLR